MIACRDDASPTTLLPTGWRGSTELPSDKQQHAFVPLVCLTWPAGELHQRIEGTLVFVDISGFTAMSERLAQKGRVGAEEVATALNTTFTALLTVATNLGGDLLKFGGDALLLLFRESGHQVRGARAAAEMQRTIRRVGVVETPSGKVSLRMSAGVHSGSHDLFMVGGSHRELVVAGPGPSTTVTMEGNAGTNFVLVSNDTALHLHADRLGASNGPGVVLARMPAKVDAAPPPSPPTNSPGDFMSEGLRGIAASASGEGEHRLITVGFIHFGESDAVLIDRGPEVLAK